jgi:hypothetical protein
MAHKGILSSTPVEFFAEGKKPVIHNKACMTGFLWQAG